MIKRIIPATIGVNNSATTTSATGRELFWVFGDSFAAGSNNTTGAGPNTAGEYFRTSDNTIQVIGASDIPGASNGSPWPQFCNDYIASTGNTPVIIPNGVGGSKFFDSWNGTSAAYLAAKQDAIDAMSVAGVTRLKGIIIICGVNDARGGDGISAIGAAIGNLFYHLDIDFPKTQIYVVMLGHSNTNAQRLAPVRWYVRNQVKNYTNCHIVCQLQAIHEWTPPAGSPGGYYGADNLHLNQTGNNLLGTMINRYMQLPTSYNKFARAVINSYYSDLSAKLSAVHNYVTTMGTLFTDNFIGYFKMKVPDKNDIFVDWAFLTVPVDNGFVFSANQFITTNTAETIRMNISTNSVSVGYTSTDLGLGAATYDRKGAFGTSSKALLGASSGATSLAMVETSTGVMQWFLYDAGTGSTGTGGFADNTEYSMMRIGTAKTRYVNGVLANSETLAANAPLTAGVEIGGRNTSGVVLELNAEIAYFFWFRATGWDPAVFYSANQTLEAEW